MGKIKQKQDEKNHSFLNKLSFSSKIDSFFILSSWFCSHGPVNDVLLLFFEILIKFKGNGLLQSYS